MEKSLITHNKEKLLSKIPLNMHRTETTAYSQVSVDRKKTKLCYTTKDKATHQMPQLSTMRWHLQKPQVPTPFPYGYHPMSCTSIPTHECLQLLSLAKIQHSLLFYSSIPFLRKYLHTQFTLENMPSLLNVPPHWFNVFPE